MPYRLHAVLVHEGQASAGHYWAYIYDHANQRWMKYNDVSITESSWEELERDSFGGMTNASAYCLMYIDDRLPQLITGTTALSHSNTHQFSFDFCHKVFANPAIHLNIFYKKFHLCRGVKLTEIIWGF